jgi:hypothetical protein
MDHIYVSYLTNVWNSMTGSPEIGSYCIFPYAKLYQVRSFRFRAVRLWNSLDIELKQLLLPINEQAVQLDI